MHYIVCEKIAFDLGNDNFRETNLRDVGYQTFSKQMNIEVLASKGGAGDSPADPHASAARL